MKTIGQVLVVVDPERRATPALQRGAALARRASARLQLCLLDHQPLIDATADIIDPEVMRLAKTQFIAERVQWLQQQCDALAAEGLAAAAETRWAPARHKALLDRVLEHQPDLVIKDAEAEDGGWLGTPDWKALRFCPAPLMLMRPDSAPLPARILAAVDTSGDAKQKAALNDAVFDLALQLGLYCGAEVHLAHVFPFHAPERERGLLTEAYEDMRRNDGEQFRAFAAAHGIADERQHLLSGDPAQTLAEFARRGGFDLLSVGAVHRSAIDRFFLGSTAESLLTLASCDVLVVKPPDFVERLGDHIDIEGLRRQQALLQAGTGLPGTR
ncbi:universal stress protein [Fontimonas sp. SYSU GA230001]|uniref:universal stress protein n=1 Tax=Fontimonas sp. SYSU GA230001 TaxID=3142450 RepID=UPI0032B53E71